jgi:hypothetical protein
MNERAQQLPFIAADVLEVLSVAMYASPEVLYRELAQNAADAIADGHARGILGPTDGRLDITIPLGGEQTVTLRDDGPGIPNAQFVERMSSIGNSSKRGGTYRGFRGIGRLSPLGYCRRLIFRTRAAGEPVVNEACWDLARARELFLGTDRISLQDGIGRALTFTQRRVEATDAPHFFEVVLENVLRLSSGTLMSPWAVTSYLGQNAAVGYDPEFSHGPAIVEMLQAQDAWFAIDVTVNGKPVYRPYVDCFPLTPRPGPDHKRHRPGYTPPEPKTSTIHEIEYFTVDGYDDQGPLTAVGWIGHHDYPGALLPSCPVRGIRLRAGNVGIGDAETLRSAFREERFASWAVGEVHVIDRRVRPNARRDDFEESVYATNLQGHLAVLASQIAARCHRASRARQHERELLAFDAALEGRAAPDNPLIAALQPTLLEHAEAALERLGKTGADGVATIEAKLRELRHHGNGAELALSPFARGQVSLVKALYAARRADPAEALLPYLHDEPTASSSRSESKP